MAVDYTMTQVVSDLKQIASIPTSQNLFDEQKIVRFMDLKLRTDLLPLIMSAREEFFVHTTDYTIDTTTEATNEYAIPERAVGMKLKLVTLVDSNDEEEDLPRITYRDRSLPGFTDFQRIWGHYIQDNHVRLHMADSFTGKTLRLYWYRRPNKLVRTSQSGKITAIDTGTKVVTLDNAPTTWTASTTFDVIQGKPGFKSLKDDQTITNIAGFDLTFSTLPTGMAVGDYVAESKESPIAQIPEEFFPLLSQVGAIKALEGLGDKSGWRVAIEDYKTMRKELLKLITPRVDDQAQKVVARKGLWRTGGARNWRR